MTGGKKHNLKAGSLANNLAEQKLLDKNDQAKREVAFPYMRMELGFFNIFFQSRKRSW